MPRVRNGVASMKRSDFKAEKVDGGWLISLHPGGTAWQADHLTAEETEGVVNALLDSEAALRERVERLRHNLETAAYTQDLRGRLVCRFCDEPHGQPHNPACCIGWELDRAALEVSDG